MKKFFPAILISFVFTLLLILQMAITGRESNATKIKEEKTKYAAFESVFQKLNLKTTKGTEINLAELKRPIVLLNFWASWCLPCIAEFKSLNKFMEMFPKDQVLVLGINNDDEAPAKSILKTEKEYNLKFESCIDKENVITGQFFISKIPASIVFYNGKVVHFSNEEFNFMDDNFILKIKKLIKNLQPQKIINLLRGEDDD